MEELDNIKLIELPKFMDDRGNLTFIEKGNQVPFDIRRVFMMFLVAKLEEVMHIKNKWS